MTPILFEGEPLTMDRATDLARRGFQPIEIYVYEPDAEKPGYLKFVRRRTPREVCKDLVAILGEYPEGGEEGLHPFADYACVNCPIRPNGLGCMHESGNKGPCMRLGHLSCTGYVSGVDAPWPEGQVIVGSVRGGSEGDYTHVEVHGKLILLCKTFAGRDASWSFARRVADLLGV
jgi:hypothetical protein